jgi:protein ImuB
VETKESAPAGLSERERKSWVIVTTARNQRLIIAASSAASARGVEVGMPLAQAQAICSDLTHREHNACADAQALTSLARWMMRFSPLVCPTFDDHSIFLDITGCQRVFGGTDRILHQIMRTLRRWRLTARAAIAPTPGAAWAIAQHQGDCPLIKGTVPLRDLPTILSPLPVGALRLDRQCLHALHHLGIVTIAQLLALPRSQLPARFGDQLLLRLDQAPGKIAEPLDFLPYKAPIRAQQDFDFPISNPEPIAAILEKLIARIAADLVRIGHGVRRMEVDFLRPYAPTIHQTIHFSRPTRDAKKILRLIQCSMEGLTNKPAPRSNQIAFNRNADIAAVDSRAYHLFPPAGFIGIILEAALVEPIEDEQLDLLDQEQRTGKIALEDLVERLRVRLGPQGLVRPELVQSHVPERAVREREEEARRHEGIPMDRDKPPARSEKPVELAKPLPPRPLQLCPPIPIRVLAGSLSEGDGRPASFVLAGINRRIVHAVGPERITGQWWQAPARTRDYFDVEDSTGRRFWIFRVIENSRWFLQGEW